MSVSFVSETNNRKKDSRKVPSEKVVFGFIGIASIAAFVLGVVNLRQYIFNPAREQRAIQQEIEEREDFFSRFDEDRVLKVTDTDEDTLSDYDELYVYGTSPYLPDSDSDGYTDAQEIASGNDPNCPTGTNCRSSRLPDEQTFIQDPFIENAPEIPENRNSVLDIANLGADEIRAIVLQSGEVTSEQLAQIDDDTLIEIYQGVLGESVGQGSSGLSE